MCPLWRRKSLLSVWFEFGMEYESGGRFETYLMHSRSSAVELQADQSIMRVREQALVNLYI